MTRFAEFVSVIGTLFSNPSHSKKIGDLYLQPRGFCIFDYILNLELLHLTIPPSQF